MRALGPEEGRIKTDIRMPLELRKLTREACDYLGLPMNAVLVLALARFLAEMSPTWAGKRRLKILDELENQFQTVFREQRTP